jgi:hypothetical protein
MARIKATGLILTVSLLLTMPPAQGFPQDQDLVVGVGFVFAPYSLPTAEQETILGQMQHAGVRVVRCSMSNDDKGLDFAQRVYAHGIKIIWLVGSTPAAGTPWPHAPEGFKGLWQGYPLSAVDPDRFRAGFEPMLAKLEAKKLCWKPSSPGTRSTGQASTPTFLSRVREEFSAWTT